MHKSYEEPVCSEDWDERMAEEYWKQGRKDPAIENAFTYHTPKENQPQMYEAIREKAKELAYLIKELVPESRERSLAMTKLEEATMWANAGIARN